MYDPRAVHQFSPVDEGVVRQKLVSAAQSAGFMVRKAESIEPGWPDELLISPQGDHFWVELKRPKGGDQPRQRRTQARLRAQGAHVVRLYSKAQVYLFLNQGAQALIALNRGPQGHERRRRRRAWLLRGGAGWKRRSVA